MGLPAGLLDGGYTRLIRPLLFRARGGDPEAIHLDLIRILTAVGSTPPTRGLLRLLAGSTGRAVEVAGISFPSRVGLAAGMDKDASAVLAWRGLGFGFAEVGTVTGRAQPGNPRPRVFRLRASSALINRMGFNNPGAAKVAATLAARGVYRGKSPTGLRVGISIGKTKVVPLEEAVEDYLTSLRLLAPHADYFAVNVSSPNTPGLRNLQSGGALTPLVGALVAEAAARTGPGDAGVAAQSSPVARDGPADPVPVPVFVKVAPDLTWAELDEVLSACADAGAAGVIATNTTLDRAGLASSDLAAAAQTGGLSGSPLTLRAREVVAYVSRHTDLPIMGVGGIMTAADAVAMLEAGASLVQLYTGFIYGGPGLPARINSLDVERRRS